MVSILQNPFLAWRQEGFLLYYNNLGSEFSLEVSFRTQWEIFGRILAKKAGFRPAQARKMRTNDRFLIPLRFIRNDNKNFELTLP